MPRFGWILIVILTAFLAYIGVSAYKVLQPTDTQRAETKRAEDWKSQNCLAAKPSKLSYDIGEIVGYIASGDSLNALYSPNAIQVSFDVPPQTVLKVVPGGDFQTWKTGDHIRACLGNSCGWVPAKAVCWIAFP
jgi:hypothetical protein